jgi:hypothetical protein
MDTNTLLHAPAVTLLGKKRLYYSNMCGPQKHSGSGIKGMVLVPAQNRIPVVKPADTTLTGLSLVIKTDNLNLNIFLSLSEIHCNDSASI